jgi:hypothetical protein
MLRREAFPRPDRTVRSPHALVLEETALRNPFPLAGLLCAIVCVSPVAAQSTATPIPAPPKPDLTALKGIIGSWSCSTKSSRRPSAVASADTFSLDPSGSWIVHKGISEASPWYPHKVTSTDYNTYDAAQKRWVDIYIDDEGAYDLTTSPGPHGNTWIWHDLSLQKPLGDVASFTDQKMVLDGDVMTSENSFTTKSGKTVNVKTACKRSS